MKPTSLLLLILLTFSFHQVNAQTPNWTWAKSAGGTRLNLDRQGNILATGSNYDPYLYSFSAYWGKYDSLGNLLKNGFINSSTTNGNVEAIAIAGDDNGNTFVTGTFDMPVAFGTTTLTTGGMYIVKYDTAGTPLWAREFSSGTSTSYKLTVDASGNIYVAGICSAGAVVGGNTLTDGGLFQLKYNPIGILLSAKSLQLIGYGFSPASMYYDEFQNLYVDGTINGTGYLSLGTSATGPGVFVFKTDSLLNAEWLTGIQMTNTSGTNSALGVSTDKNGNVFLTGYLDFPMVINQDTLFNSNPAGYDLFIAKFDSAGNYLWNKTAGGTMNDYGAAVACDSDGSVYIGGYFSSPTLHFGNNTLTNHTSTGVRDGFLVKCDSSGNYQWGKTVGGSNDDVITSTLVGDNNKLYISGNFNSSSILFATGSGNITVSNGLGYYTPFLAALQISTTTGVDQLNSVMNDVSLYPNPAIKYFTIKIPEISNSTFLTIYNSIGLIVCRKKLIDTCTSLSTEQFNPGVYFVKVSNLNSEVTQKLIIR